MLNVAQTPPAPVKAPGYAAADRFGASLKALGASSVTPNDSMTLTAEFPSTLDMVRANRVVNDTLYGAKLVMTTPPTGVFPAEPTVTDLQQTLRRLPDVSNTGTIDTFEGPLLLGVYTPSRQGASLLSGLLRPEIAGHKVQIEIDHAVEPNQG